MNVADLIIKYLEEVGVEFIFGIPGGSLEPLYEAVNKNGNIDVILAKHEEGAAFMAGGYARAGNRLGVCWAATGPGSTNLITGIATSYADSIPVLAITGQVATSLFGKGAAQESTCDGINIVELFRHVTKHSAMLINPEKAGEMVRQALRVATSGRKGPVHLNIPMDIMKKEVTGEIIPLAKFRPSTLYFDRYSIRTAATLLLEAKKPAILLGNGTLLSGAVGEVGKLAEMLTIPVATTPKAKGGFPENHPLSLGVFGLAGAPMAGEYLLRREAGTEEKNPEGESSAPETQYPKSNVDVLLTVGTSFNEEGTHAWDKRLKPEKALIQVDIDPYEFGKNYPFDVGLMGDAKIIMRELTYEILRRLDTSGEKERRARELHMTEELVGFKEKNQKYEAVAKMMSEDVPLKPQRLMKDLRESFSEDTLFFVDIGSNLLWGIHYLDIIKPYTFFIGLGFASMGFGAAAVVGGKFAAPDKPVVAIVGDGGFLMNGMEVATAVNYRKQVIWIVENNSQYGMVSQARKHMGYSYTTGAEFQQVNFAKIAEGLGAEGRRITKPGEINKKMMDDIVASGKPTVLDVIIDRDEAPPLGLRIKALKEEGI